MKKPGPLSKQTLGEQAVTKYPDLSQAVPEIRARQQRLAQYKELCNNWGPLKNETDLQSTEPLVIGGVQLEANGYLTQSSFTEEWLQRVEAGLREPVQF